MSARPLRFLVGQPRDHEWLTMEALAVHGAFSSAEAARIFVRRHGVPFAKRGRRLLVDKAVYDRFIIEAGRKVSA